MRGLVYTGVLAAVGLFFGGCAHYRLPLSRLESPEARGNARPIRPAELSAGFLSSADLEATPSTQTSETGVTTTSLQSTFTPMLGFAASLAEMTDLGLRFQAQGPLSFRLKHQLSGEPLSRAHPGNFAISVIAAPGVLLGSGAAGSSSLFVGDLTLIGGYRIGERHLVSLAPYFTFSSASGLPMTGATSYGAALGYQYQYETILLRTELAFTSGSAGTASMGGMHVGISLGLMLDQTPYGAE